MSLSQKLSFENENSSAKNAQAQDRKVRYAVVGGGWIAQNSFLPGVKHTGNSVVTALVTGDPVKARELAPLYDIEYSYDYSQFDELLDSGNIDAIYLSLPNWQHADYAVRALAAGIHVLLEKPMDVTEDACKRILAAHKVSRAKLMVAYRLHFEPATLRALERIREGEFGPVYHFSSVFTQTVDPSNSRAQHGYEAGPVFDMGPYPINAVRNIFQCEPEEVFAVATRHPESNLDLDDTVTVLLKFPQGRTAQFVVSYNGGDVNQYTVTGRKGWLEVNPGFQMGMGYEHFSSVTRDGEPKEDHEKFSETDHFGGETKYFSECILEDKFPEPDGEEGWLDVRVILAIKRSLETGQVQKLEPYKRKRQIDVKMQRYDLRKVRAKELVDAQEPSKKEPPQGSEIAA
jgi:predicted dehydrogenase